MRFVYTVKDPAGKTFTATDDAPDEQDLVSRLQNQGFFIVSLRLFSETLPKKTETKLSNKAQFKRTKITLDDLVLFCQQLATMLNSGVNLLRSLDVISMQVESRKLSEILAQVKKSVEQGNSLSSSLAKHPKVFNQFWISVIEVGEASGNMPVILEKLAFYLEREAAFRATVLSAVLYPAILFVVAIGAILCFALVIGPKFKTIFDSFHTELPPITKALLAIFDFIKTKFLVLILVVGGIILLIKQYIQTLAGRIQMEKLLFSLPQFGNILRIIVIERFTSQLSILVDSGVPILYALEITQRMVGNKICEGVIGEIKNNVREGKLIAEPMSRSGFFPPMAVQMILIGEETGELAKMLRSVSEYYRAYVETFMKRFGVVFEPIMLIFMGVVIGVIVIAMFLPIFNISQLGG